MSTSPPRILYCHCQYAQVVPKEVKEAVLRQLCDAGIEFEAVADLCELSARKDPAMQRLASEGSVKIAACFPRAVKWLFHQAGAPLDTATTEVLNMRTQPADHILLGIFAPGVRANLPTGKETAPAPAEQLTEQTPPESSSGELSQTQAQPALA